MIDVFSIPDYTFPEGFLWGSAVSAHQTEGMNTNSDRWNIEQQQKKSDPLFETSGMACNSYNLYNEDIKILKSLNNRVFRLTVEWARIEPIEGHFDRKETEHYKKLLSSLKAANIMPFVTLVHLSVPQWFREKGYFTKIENLKYFERYLEYIVPEISEYTEFWNVINEFNLVLDDDPLGVEFKLNSLHFHALGYHIIKKYSKKPVSSAHALIQYMPLRPYDKYDMTMTDFCDFRDHEFFFHAIRTGEVCYPFKDGYYCADIKDTADFWSINCYTRNLIDSRKHDLHGKRYNHTRLKMIDMDFYLEEMYPETMIALTRRLLDKPIFISENGCSCNDDRFRIVYIATYLSALSEAIKLGADVSGYLYWSLMDNYEWFSYIPKFGLVSVDRDSFERTVKPSGLFYRDIIANNGFSQKILRKYLKEMPALK